MEYPDNAYPINGHKGVDLDSAPIDPKPTFSKRLKLAAGITALSVVAGLEGVGVLSDLGLIGGHSSTHDNAPAVVYVPSSPNESAVTVQSGPIVTKGHLPPCDPNIALC